MGNPVGRRRLRAFPLLTAFVLAYTLALVVLAGWAVRVARAEAPPGGVGVAVVAAAEASDAAWPLARSLYADAALRPPSLDETHARVLCGERAPPGSDAELLGLTTSVAQAAGGDAGAGAVLADLGRRFGVRALIVVHVAEGRATARAFVSGRGAFESVVYLPDDATGQSWSAATRGLLMSFGSRPDPAGASPGPPLPGPALAMQSVPKGEGPHGRGKAFYLSGWFWGALGVALLAGGAVVLGTRDKTPSTIHLEVQVPR
jgi:hypothetical protein